MNWDMTWRCADNGGRSEVSTGACLFPQHPGTYCWWGFRRDLNLKTDFYVTNIARVWAVARRPTLAELLELIVEAKYPDAGAVEIFYNSAKKARARGNGFGYGGLS